MTHSSLEHNYFFFIFTQHCLIIIFGNFAETAMGCPANIFKKEEGIKYKAAADFMGFTLMYR